jgi:Lectin C-type domain
MHQQITQLTYSTPAICRSYPILELPRGVPSFSSIALPLDYANRPWRSSASPVRGEPLNCVFARLIHLGSPEDFKLLLEGNVMWQRTCAICVLALISTASISQAQTVIDGPILSPINGHYYSILSNSNWTSAEAVAQSMGGNLATIRSSAEETWIQNTFSAYPYVWIGLYDPSQDGNGHPHADNFVWVDGEPITYTDWYPEEPNDFDGGEYWTQLILASNPPTDGTDTWNDITNDADPEHAPNFYGPDYGLVEVAPEPGTLSLLALGSLPLLLRRRRAGK